MWKILGGLFFIYLLGMVLFVVIPQMQEAFCKGRWSESGLAAEFRWMQGCMVSVDGRRIPERNVRLSPR